MILSRVWATNRQLSCCSMILAKHLIQSPSKLLVKLRNLDFSRSFLSWICSYLYGSSQCVFSGSTSSSYTETNLGVALGSVLDPLLFFLYVNDLQVELGIGLVLHLLYADVLQIYIKTSPELFHNGLMPLT